MMSEGEKVNDFAVVAFLLLVIFVPILKAKRK